MMHFAFLAFCILAYALPVVHCARERPNVVLRHYSNMLHATWVGWAVAGGIPWLWPLFAILHSFGIALLIGCVATLDLRLLGVGKALPAGPIERLAPWGIVGFVITLITGIGFYAGSPEQYQSSAFAAKMACIVLAGANIMLSQLTGLAHRVEAVGAGQDAPLAAKLSAVTSLFLWITVMFWGRMLTFFSNTF
jgi:hypothetical protein